MPTIIEMDPAVTLADQSREGGGPVILVNTITAPPEDADRAVAAWAAEAAAMKRRPGLISAQLHRGIAGSGVFLNYVMWESVAHFRAAFESPEFKASLGAYPATVTVCPHLFRRVAVPGICVA